MIDEGFWKTKKVFITGHTGFKGSWLCLWLTALGAEVTGYALQPPTDPSLFALCRIHEIVRSVTADIRDPELLRRELTDAAPDVVIHMAARSLVRDSYKDPVGTYETNVMGTVNLLEAVRKTHKVKAVLVVTSDKCYENREWVWGYRENEPLGGYDPYSSSKASSELVTAAYRSSFFNPKEHERHGVAVASARAGNVIGGGDWAPDRLLPDCVRGLLKGEKIRIRSPRSVRPWQHVLEPLSGYLMLAQRLFSDGPAWGAAWNFGPDDRDARPVEWLVRRVCEKWGAHSGYEVEGGVQPHEAHYLRLDCSKAKSELGWYPRWPIETALDRVIEWTKGYAAGEDLRRLSLTHIEKYTASEVDS